MSVGAYGVKRWVYIFAAALVFNTTGAGFLCAAGAVKAPACCVNGNHRSEATTLHHSTSDCCTASAPTSQNNASRWTKSNINNARRLGKNADVQVQTLPPIRLRAQAAACTPKIHSTKPPFNLSPLLTGCVLRI